MDARIGGRVCEEMTNRLRGRGGEMDGELLKEWATAERGCGGGSGVGVLSKSNRHIFSFVRDIIYPNPL